MNAIAQATTGMSPLLFLILGAAALALGALRREHTPGTPRERQLQLPWTDTDRRS